MSDEKSNTSVSDETTTLTKGFVLCKKCNQYKPIAKHSKSCCADCERLRVNRVSYMYKHQDWIAEAKEQGLDLWVQQPGETQQEFTIWTAFRDSYPGGKPTYRKVADQLGFDYKYIADVARRWSFPMRMQAWIAECDRITLLQRREEVLNMNREHIDIANRMREKISKAVDNLMPEELTPRDIASLAKLSTELERRARLDTIDQEALQRELCVDTSNPELKTEPTKQGDLSEVLGVLMQAGVLGDAAQVGVRKTETTEVVVKDNTGQSSSIEFNN